MIQRTLHACALVLLLAAGSAAGQPGEERRGAVPPGSAADGSRPAEGAIVGGTSDAPTIERRVERCNALSGTLREQCLRDAMNPSAGSSRPAAPGSNELAKPRPPDAPPPQNPR